MLTNLFRAIRDSVGKVRRNRPPRLASRRLLTETLEDRTPLATDRRVL
jgi:hypothetical protein